jgi:hypothetical protein
MIPNRTVLTLHASAAPELGAALFPLADTEVWIMPVDARAEIALALTTLVPLNVG